MKVCTVCKLELTLDKFYNSKQTKDGKGYRCKDCERLVVKSYRTRYYEQTKEWQRQRNRKSKYGLSKEQYEDLKLAQDCKCAVCKVVLDFSVKPDMKIRAVVDHCHSTNKVRGLLCSRCNQALGLFDDDKEKLQGAITYLELYKTIH